MVRLRDGLALLWRSPGEAQIGLDPRCGVVVSGLTDGEQRLLDLLAGDRGTPPTTADVLETGRGLGVPAARARRLLMVLGRAGVLVPDATAPAGAPRAGATVHDADISYWSRLRPDADGHGLLSRRQQAVAAVLGLGRLGMLAASGLAAAGVGTVLLADTARVRLHDVAPGAFGPEHVGRVREEAGTHVLRAGTPGVRTSATPGTRPDVAIAVDHGVADPVRVRPLVREDIPHLSVVVGEVDVVVGPLVVPGRGPCLRCLDLHRCDADDRWPAVATQVAARPQEGVESSTAGLGAALAVAETLAHVDGRRADTSGSTLELSAAAPLPRRRTWAPHPSCGCAGPGKA